MTLNQTVKRINLIILSLLAIAFIGLSLAESANSPQAQTRLDLMQTDLILEVSAWQPQLQEMETLRNVLVGTEPKAIYTQAIEAYQTALNSNQALLGVTQKSEQISQNINDLSLRLGILYARVNKIPEAIATWQKVSFQDSNTAQVLRGLWSQPALIFPDAELQIRSSLNGWFGSQALEQLFIAQERWGAIDSLAISRESSAERAVEKLVLTSSITVIGGGLGVICIVILAIQRLFFAKSSPLQPSLDLIWTTPWQPQKTWEVMVLWFTAYVAVSQIFLPTALHLLNIYPDASWDSKDRAILILLPYIFSMAPMLLIFRTTLREFLPFPSYIFSFKFWTWSWLGWGLGGYIVAIPIVLIISALNQLLLGGQGGGNPLLPILAADQNDIAKVLLWMTVAIAAPLFEELLFRGFLLPSLISGFTKRLPVSFVFLSTWLGIGASGLFFAIAHLNLADILPLTALGMVLGFVYVRSQNLFAPMLLHSLWNSGTFLTLLVLGSSGS